MLRIYKSDRFMKIIKTLILLFLIQGIYSNTFAQSQDLSANAQKFKTNLLSFLREEGYVPTVDNNGKTVNFKREGENYWIDLSGSMPVQITMHIGGFGNKEANVLAILLACNEVNRDKYYVKAYVDDFGEEGSTNITIEMPCHTAEEFRYVFNDCVRALSSAKPSVQEAYSKHNEDLGNSNTSTNYVSYPKYSTTSGNTSCKIVGVDCGTQETKVYFEYTNKYSSGGWCSIDPQTYISTQSGAQYKLIRAEGIPKSPKQYTFNYSGQKLAFTLVFPALPKSTTQFNLIESSTSEWKFYNIKLK